MAAVLEGIQAMLAPGPSLARKVDQMERKQEARHNEQMQVLLDSNQAVHEMKLEQGVKLDIIAKNVVGVAPCQLCECTGFVANMFKPKICRCQHAKRLH